MPVFEYECEACGRIFETFTASRDVVKVACRECGSENVSRVWSTFASRTSGGSCGPTSGGVG